MKVGVLTKVGAKVSVGDPGVASPVEPQKFGDILRQVNLGPVVNKLDQAMQSGKQLDRIIGGGQVASPAQLLKYQMMAANYSLGLQMVTKVSDVAGGTVRTLNSK